MSDKLYFLPGITQNISENLISPRPLCLEWFVIPWFVRKSYPKWKYSHS